MKKQHRDYRNHKKEVAADPKQRSHGMSERTVQKIHVRSLFSLLVGTAVRAGSLYSAYSRNQTASFDSSAWYPNSGTTTTIEAEQVTITVTEAMHTWAAGMKEQLIRIEINMKATSKESLRSAVRTMNDIEITAEKKLQKSEHTSTKQQGVTVNREN